MIGILGGTFDPVHFGHLRLAEEAAQRCDLEQVRLIPAGTPPLRGAPRAAPSHRLEMLRLAARDNPRLCIDEREITRTDPCYTVDTLAGLRAELGAGQAVCLILGLDQFLRLPSWSRWPRLFELAHIAVAARPGFAPDAPVADEALQRELDTRLVAGAEALRSQSAGCILRFDMTALDISATHIRQQLATGLSPRYLLPDLVLDYIHRNNLYTGG